MPTSQLLVLLLLVLQGGRVTNRYDARKGLAKLVEVGELGELVSWLGIVCWTPISHRRMMNCRLGREQFKRALGRIYVCLALQIPASSAPTYDHGPSKPAIINPLAASLSLLPPPHTHTLSKPPFIVGSEARSRPQTTVNGARI